MPDSYRYFLPTLLRSGYHDVAGINLERGPGALRVDYLIASIRIAGVNKCCFSTTRFSHPMSGCSTCGERLAPFPPVVLTSPTFQNAKPVILDAIEAFEWAPDVLSAELLAEPLFRLIMDGRRAFSSHFELIRRRPLTAEPGEKEILRRFAKWEPGLRY